MNITHLNLILNWLSIRRLVKITFLHCILFGSDGSIVLLQFFFQKLFDVDVDSCFYLFLICKNIMELRTLNF